MAYIMDMASGTEHPVEEPSYSAVRKSSLGAGDIPHLDKHPQLQLAMIEIQTQAETRTLPAASLDALIKTLGD